ncbi:hypothetical protein GCM10023238_14740 [Streptomyces heliomycini]
MILIGEEDGRNEVLARVIADRTGTRTWFTYGDLRLETAPSGRRVPVLAAPASANDPAGTWVPADPGLVPDDPEAPVRASDGTVFPDSDIHTYPLVTVDGQALTGRVFLDAHDMAMREEALRVVSAIQHYTNVEEGLPVCTPDGRAACCPCRGPGRLLRRRRPRRQRTHHPAPPQPPPPTRRSTPAVGPGAGPGARACGRCPRTGRCGCCSASCP